MSDSKHQETIYKVQLGFNEVIVNSTSMDEAITLAKQKLALELPRFYDIIRDLSPNRFVVQRAA